MAFRTIVISKRCKLEYSLNYLVCRSDDEKKILVDEIEMLIIQCTGVSITCALISELINRKVKIIFCDSKSNPAGEVVSYYNNYSNFKRISQQISIKQDTKDEVWKALIKEKILSEASTLKRFGLMDAFQKLTSYCDEVNVGDSTNREGHAAKVYFNALFGQSFSRGDATNDINKFLNYGYSIIVSFINREIKAYGFLTELGIHHIGETNPFNLSYDIFEPLRCVVDRIVINKEVNNDNYKDVMVNILSSKVIFNENEMYFDNAIHLYVQSVFNALIKDDVTQITFINYEL